MKISKKVFILGSAICIATTGVISSSLIGNNDAPNLVQVDEVKEAEVIEVKEESEVEEKQVTAPVEVAQPTESEKVVQPAQEMTVQERVQAYDVTTIDGAVHIAYGNFPEEYRNEAIRCINLLQTKRPDRFYEGNKISIVQNLVSRYRPAGICELAESL